MQGRIAAAMVHRRSSGEVRPYVRSNKPRFNWTLELKLLFQEAMALLGGTRKATPKQIRELMKCPHIQLSHIKSRLQMCRIRLEEKERRPGTTNSSEEVQRKRRTDNNDANNKGDEQSVVVDETEPNNVSTAALSVSMPSSSLDYEYSQRHFFYPSPQSLQPPSKRLRLDQINPSASSWQTPQRICDAGAIKFQFCFDYFGPSQEYGAVMPVLPNPDFFREEQSDPPYILEEAEEDLQLSLSLPMPCRAKMINLDLSISFPES